jgi:hypothetical protein
VSSLSFLANVANGDWLDDPATSDTQGTFFLPYRHSSGISV